MGKILCNLLVVLSFLSLSSLAFGGALIHTTLEGKIVAVNQYKGHTVRVAVRNHAWPNEQHDVVIESATKIYWNGRPAQLVSSNTLHKGDTIKASGGLTTFGNRIVADTIIIIRRKT